MNATNQEKPVAGDIELLLRPHPIELDKGVWYQEEARAERLANLIRLVYTLIWLVAVSPSADIHPLSANIGNIGGGLLWFLFAVIYHYYLLKRPYKPVLKYVSTTVDILMTTGMLFTYHYGMGYSASLKAPPFMNYLLTLALAAIRFNASLPIYGGTLAIVTYLFLFSYLLVTQNVEFGLPLDLFTTPKISFVYQIYRVFYLATGTLLVFILVRNIQRLVHLRVREVEKALVEKAEREKTKVLFERYFSPDIANYLTDNPQDIGGRSQRVTMLITDLRDFTAISEMLGPAGSVNLLNKVFESLVEIVFEYKGTLDKFTGDGMLVVFGVPKSKEDDAHRAIMAARKMVEKIRNLDMGITLNIGIAIHTGNVIFGNIGSTQRMELTVIGDTVNTVSRIEELNKELGTDIIISETTYEEVRYDVQAHKLPSRKLRGKSEEIQLYTLDEVTGRRE